jgi:hypothetical protein
MCAQVKSYMAPSFESVQAVGEWLASEGISANVQVGHGDWLGFSTTVSQAGRLFNASFSTYRHVSTGSEQVRTMAYSVPAHIQQHIELVHPMTACVYFCSASTRSTHGLTGSRCRRLVTPSRYSTRRKATLSSKSARSRSLPPACKRCTASPPSQPRRPTTLSPSPVTLASTLKRPI